MEDWESFWDIGDVGRQNYVELSPSDLMPDSLPGPSDYGSSFGSPLSLSDRLRNIAGNLGVEPEVGSRTPGGNVVGTDFVATQTGESRFLELMGQIGGAAAGIAGRLLGGSGSADAVQRPGTVNNFLAGAARSPLLLIAIVAGVILVARRA